MLYIIRHGETELNSKHSIKDECSDGFFGIPESVFRIKKLLF